MARNNNKINYPTNVVNPITYATYMQMIESQPEHKVDVSYASNTLFPSIKNGKDGEGKKDTHTIGVLIDYGLAKYVDKKTVELTHFGRRFLEVFKTNNEEDPVRMNRKEDVDINYNALMLEIILNWSVAVGEKIFYPGALLIRLLMDERLQFKFNAYEWAFVCGNEDFIETSNYDKLVDDIIEFRNSGKEIELKKAHDFCNSLANSWALLDKDKDKFYLLREVTKENIKDWSKNNKDLLFSIKAVSETSPVATSGNEEDEGDNLLEENVSCLDVFRTPREEKLHPLNFIIYGAPGTGKTYSMVEHALSIVEHVSYEEFVKNNQDRKQNVANYKNFVKAGQIVFTTFHQNYGYEEFIQGLRPDKDSETMNFKVVDGVFKKIADTALKDTDGKNYVIIIDEINRANISKVFGELITLIEEDKRWGELNETSATLQSGDQFAVPNNLYIIGTMNSADKSISLIDAALRRRFEFIEQPPDSNLVDDSVLKAVLENINENLVNELESTDLLVGHSYFMNRSKTDLCTILNNNIIPLLYEYFYDNRKKVAKVLSDAITKANATVEIVDGKVGRLKVREKED